MISSLFHFNVSHTGCKKGPTHHSYLYTCCLCEIWQLFPTRSEVSFSTPVIIAVLVIWPVECRVVIAWHSEYRALEAVYILLSSNFAHLP